MFSFSIYPTISIVGSPTNYSSMDEIKFAWYAIAGFLLVRLILAQVLKSSGYTNSLTSLGLLGITFSLIFAVFLTIMPFVAITGFYSVWASVKSIVYITFLFNVLFVGLILFQKH